MKFEFTGITPCLRNEDAGAMLDWLAKPRCTSALAPRQRAPQRRDECERERGHQSEPDQDRRE